MHVSGDYEKKNGKKESTLVLFYDFLKISWKNNNKRTVSCRQQNCEK